MIKYNSNRGMTLIEVIVTLGIFVIILMAVGRLQFNILDYNRYSSDYIQSGQDASSILRTMVKEMRIAKIGSNGSYPIAQAATSTIVFYSDIDSDGLQDQVRYYISTTTLKKGIIKPTGSPLTYVAANEKLSTLAYSLKNGTSTPLFEYFDNNYTGTSSPLSIPVNIPMVRLVRINLLIDADPKRSPLPRLYTSDVMLRNLKDNL